MTRVFECDWCETQFRDREDVYPVEVTLGASVWKGHACQKCFDSWGLE